MKNDVIIALKLALICFVAVLLLSMVNFLTEKKIKMTAEANVTKSNKELFPEGAEFLRKEFDTDKTSYYFDVYDSRKNHIGYITAVTGKGFSGDLPLLIAFNKNFKILNIKLLKNSETPGFGKKWEKQKSMDMFVNTNTAEMPFPAKKSMVREEFRDTPHGVSGATITFNGITEATVRAIQLMEKK